MLKEELDYYMDVVEILKDDRSISDEWITLVLRGFNEIPAEKRTREDGISFLAVNAIRKHRGLAYPA